MTGAQAITNENDSDSDVVDDIQELDKQALQTPTNEDSKAVINIEEYVPVITDNRQWVLSELDLGTDLIFRNRPDYSDLISENGSPTDVVC